MYAKGGRSVVHLLAEIVRFADLTDQLELRLEPIGVGFFSLQNRFHQVASAVVTLSGAHPDPGVETDDRLFFQRKCQTESRSVAPAWMAARTTRSFTARQWHANIAQGSRGAHVESTTGRPAAISSLAVAADTGQDRGRRRRVPTIS